MFFVLFLILLFFIILIVYCHWTTWGTNVEIESGSLPNTHKLMWQRMRKIGIKNGVIINTWVPKHVRGDLFYESMIYNWKRWLKESLLPEPVIIELPPEEIQHKEELVIGLGSFWGTEHIPKCFIALMSEWASFDSELVIGMKKTHETCYKGEGAFFGVSFSPAIAKSLDQPHAYWIWHKPNNEVCATNSSKFNTINENKQFYVWMNYTNHREQIVDKIVKEGFEVTACVTHAVPNADDRCKDLDAFDEKEYIFLNIHQQNYKETFAHLEIHRLTHPCIQGKCIISEKSSDEQAELDMMNAGYLHAVWDGDPKTLPKVIKDAKGQWHKNKGKRLEKAPTPIWLQP